MTCFKVLQYFPAVTKQERHEKLVRIVALSEKPNLGCPGSECEAEVLTTQV
jgi:hypothetical protein